MVRQHRKEQLCSFKKDQENTIKDLTFEVILERGVAF